MRGYKIPPPAEGESKLSYWLTNNLVAVILYGMAVAGIVIAISSHV